MKFRQLTFLIAFGVSVNAYAAAPYDGGSVADTVVGEHFAPDMSGHLSATMTARDAGSAQWFFATAPERVMPLLPENTRLDMLDYFNSGVERPSRNSAGGSAIVTASTDRLLSFKMGEGVDYQLGVFTTAKGDTLVAVAETIHIPMADTRIAWYGRDWTPAESPVAEPLLADWLTAPGRKHRKAVEEQLPFLTASATLRPEQGEVAYVRSVDSYFVPSEKPEALSYLEQTLVRKLRK